jgi:hypothetical protein
VLRPNLLRRNAHGEFPVIVVDGAVTSDLSTTLHTLPVREIAAVRQLSAPQAVQRYPLEYGHEVVEVRTLHARVLVDSALGCS